MNSNQQLETLIIEQDSLVYSINNENMTAKIIDNYDEKKDIIIPHSIYHQSKKYVITSISKNAFQYSKKLKSIKFSPNSKLTIIEKDAFKRSEIKILTIPPNLIKLEDEWCNKVYGLNKIFISQKNPYYKLYDGKLILKKSSNQTDNYDVLVFCFRNATSVTIPKFIKRIDPFAFEGCRFLNTIKIQSDSQLQIIGKGAFTTSSVEFFVIPSQVTQICEGCFANCYNLKSVKFSSNSKLQKIDDFTFYNSSIERITLPSNLKQIGQSAFDSCYKLQNVQISPHSELIKIDERAFYHSSLESITIPIHLKNICKEAFSNCYNLQSLEFPLNSELEKIDEYTFRQSSLENITLPIHLKEICPYAFSECIKLQNVEFPNNSELHTIHDHAFTQSSLKSISLPKNLIEICEDAFSFCKYLEKIEIPLDSELKSIKRNAFSYCSLTSFSIPANLIYLDKYWCIWSLVLAEIRVSKNNPYFKSYDGKFILKKSSNESKNYDVLLFCVKTIEKVKIPSFIKHIGPYAFESCIMLQTVEIPKDSELQTIGEYAFSNSAIENISIPPSLTKISEYTFMGCTNLRNLNIPMNSKLQIIGKYALNNASIECIVLPSNLIKICEGTFSGCRNLRKVEIPKNSKLQTIEQNAFRETLISQISITSNLIELEDGWCIYANKVESISVDQKNPRYRCIDDKIIIGKSIINTSKYDILVFCAKNVEKIKIPSSIKHIAPYAFTSCSILKTVEIPIDSELQTIGEYAFSGTAIECISMPSRLKNIHISAFDDCDQLKKVITYTELQTNDEYAVFDSSTITNSNFFSHIINIKTNLFQNCPNLEEIDISSQSNHQIIEKLKLNDSVIDTISIPSKLIEFDEQMHYKSIYVNYIKVNPQNPYFISYNNQFILKKSSNDSKNYEHLVFCVKNIKNVIIPNFIKYIDQLAFQGCNQIKEIQFQPYSKLEMIDRSAFAYSSIKHIILPPRLETISERAFFGCNQLKSVEIPLNSQIQMIGEDAFTYSLITGLSVVPYGIDIDSDAFFACESFQIIEYDEIYNIQNIDIGLFVCCRQILIMISSNSD